MEIERLDKHFILGSLLRDLPKAFDWIPHILIIDDLAAYGVVTETKRMIYPFIPILLFIATQRSHYNTIYSHYNEIISGVPQGSILASNLFNFSIKVNDIKRLEKE